ncbi:MAG: hypothetical protein MZV65_40090 [Chromatiales bacterium]|nr:hypothetical protein [Chromatiales bacterium]
MPHGREIGIQRYGADGLVVLAHRMLDYHPRIPETALDPRTVCAGIARRHVSLLQEVRELGSVGQGDGGGGDLLACPQR